MILSVLALAGDRKALIPAWIRLPTTGICAVIVASVIVTVTVAAVATIISRNETPGATTIYP